MKTKECPSCAMDIDSKEKKCPVCGHKFDKFPLWQKIIALLLLLAFLLVFIL